MVEDSHPVTSAEVNGARVTGRSRFERIVIWIILAGFLVAATVEVAARISYGTTLSALRNRVESAGRRSEHPTFVELEGLISGWPRASKQQLPIGMRVEYRWWSIYQDLRIRLQGNAKDTVVALATGDEPLQAPLEPAQAESPQVVSDQPSASNQSVFRKAARNQVVARGLADPAGGGLAIDLHGTGMPGSIVKGRLLREIVRQSLLIAARDELGQPTRDRALGEPLPDEENAALPVLDVATTIDAEGNTQIAVTKQVTGGFEALVSTQLSAVEQRNRELDFC